MKKTLPISLSLAAMVLLSFHPITRELPIGSAIPNADIKMKDISGKEISFRDARKENGLLVMFTCNTCPVVIKNQERTNEICKLALEKNIGVILLNANEASREDGDSFKDMQDYATEQGYKWNYVLDKNSLMADAFGAQRTPECFLFNKNLTLIYHGAIDDNPGNPVGVSRRHLSEAVTEMLSGKDISVKTTRSVGCGIKRL
jgi:redoxin